MRCLLLALVAPAAAHAQLVWLQSEIPQTPGPTATSQVYAFKAKNTGSQAVTVASITPGCACLTASTNVQNVAPGAEVTLTAVMELGQMQGEQRKQLIVTSQGAKVQRDTLTAVAQLEPFFKLTGNVAKFEQGTPGAPHNATIKVLSKEAMVLKLGKPSSSAVTAQLVEILAGREYRVTLTPVDLSKKGLGSVTLTTDSPYPRAKQLDLFYTIVAPRKP